MGRVISIGTQSFEKIIKENCFYVDKTELIKEWWDSNDSITLITRPRRFGKTINMDMLNCFFSDKFSSRGDLFEKLSIWENKKYRELQGTYPVIFLSFADVKQNNFKDAVQKIKNIILSAFNQFDYIKNSSRLTDNQKNAFKRVCQEMDDVTATDSIRILSECIYTDKQKKVIILLDEYDTPMQEAWLGGYWDEFTSFMRSLFNSSLKTNPFLERAMMTGVTRVSKESIFSDLNNLKVITTTSEKYETCFGFTEKEVFSALDEMGLGAEKEAVKKWYDGFSFGKVSDVYNPWSITNYLDEKKLLPYWADTSSNGLISKFLISGSSSIKCELEDLISGKEIIKRIDEQIIFSQLEKDEDAIWSLMLASGYLKIVSFEYKGEFRELFCTLAITNTEVKSMMNSMLKGWFSSVNTSYNNFIKFLLRGQVEEMNYYLGKICAATFSFFDTQNSEPERFYHGFVLGLISELRDKYFLSSNRESGIGRYDITLEPRSDRDKSILPIIIEFKVFNSKTEKTLDDTVQKALAQIEDKKYDTVLIEKGYRQEEIKKYGFAFKGKEVMIGAMGPCLAAPESPS